MPFQSEKQRRYLWANEPEIAREWTDRYGASQGGLTRLPFITGGFPGLTQEMLDMTYPDEYYKNVIEPAKTGKGPVPSKINMIKNAGITGPFKAMRIGIDPYLPKSMQTGYDAFRAAPTKAVGTAARGLKNFIGGNIASGLPLAYAYGADKLQQSIPEELQGVMSEDIISQGAMGAGAGQDIEWDETLREEGGGLADLFSNLGIGSAEAATNVSAPFMNPNPENTMGNWSELDDLEAQEIDSQRQMELANLVNQGEQYPSMETTDKGGILDWITNKGTGLRQGLSLANENYLMPAVAGLMGIANRYNPLRKGSQNYNPDLQNQIDMLKASGHLGGGDPSGPYRITSGPLAGKNLVSAFGTNDYGRMLDKKLAYFQKRKDEDKSFSQKLWDEAQAEKDRLDREAKQRAAAAQVRSNIQRYGSGDRPNTGMNAPGGGKGQSPTGGNVSGTPFAQGGLVR